MKLLSVNAGSSTLKFRLYEMPEEEVLMKGTFDRIGLEGSNYSIRVKEEKIGKDIVINNHEEAVKLLLNELLEQKMIKSLDEIAAVGHRIVHGGNKYSRSVVIDDRVIQEIESISDLAPLHNPANLVGVKVFRNAIPTAVQVACFDTAFHQTMKEKNYLYSVPYEWYVKYHVRKYGFHGLSHRFITEKMKQILNKENPNLIICHIGNGASIAAIEEGKSIDTSMGFTPNAGIMMGTRSGNIDYSMLNYVSKKTGFNFDRIDSLLNKESGLEGIAGMSDLRDLDRAFYANEEKVILAFDMYTDKIVEYIAKYYVKLNGKIDAICFTAGGGENDSIIRGETLKKLTSLGIVLDEEKNNETIVRKGKEGIITKEESKIPVYVVATDEELMIARDTYTLSKN
ncbi:MAG: acetate kinase [Bacilli bacterium]|nr:acetate kinase [Bacilli bacterium]